MWQLPAWSSQLFETCGASELADLGVNTVGGVPPLASCSPDLHWPSLLLVVHLIWIGACAMPAFHPLNAKHLLNVGTLKSLSGWVRNTLMFHLLSSV